MAMTKLEYKAKLQILDILNKQGYPRYAKLFNKFDLNLTKDPGVVAYMEPGKARIVVNLGLDIEQVSTVVRHEILHEYLAHDLRLSKHVGKDAWDKRSSKQHKIGNIAGDYEISNRGYTDEDKAIARSIKLNGETLKGLVTEDDHPDWVNKTVEEMYDLLSKEMDNEKEEAQQSISIGSMGDPEIQELEEIERQANAISDDAGEMIDQSSKQNSKETNKEQSSDNTSGSDNIRDDETSAKDKADKIAKAAGKLSDEIEEKEQNKDKSGNVFRSPEEISSDEKIKNRLAGIKAAFDELKSDELIQEVSANKRKQKEREAERNLAKYRNQPLTKFMDSLNQFIRKEISVGRDSSWKRFNKTYARSNIIKPGRSASADVKIPLINVYFDRSGSWDSNKTAVGLQAISTLNNYVRQGAIKIRLYYFSDNVHEDEASAIAEGGTKGQPILNHIEQTKPDNVIVMTDSDIGDCRTSVKVPGAVWFLFKGGESDNLMEHLQGEKQTLKFNL